MVFVFRIIRATRVSIPLSGNWAKLRLVRKKTGTSSLSVKGKESGTWSGPTGMGWPRLSSQSMSNSRRYMRSMAWRSSHCSSLGKSWYVLSQ
ncbi:MAG: hypothetical protein IPG32_03660 [Saprospirales bacterium]|nr:hypothetical protein [Saprospirales bacterium]